MNEIRVIEEVQNEQKSVHNIWVLAHSPLPLFDNDIIENDYNLDPEETINSSKSNNVYTSITDQFKVMEAKLDQFSNNIR